MNFGTILNSVSITMRVIVMILSLALPCQYCPANSLSVKDGHYVDTIRTQAEFDSLLNKASNKHEINAYLKPGTYIVSRTQPIYTQFYLRGNGATLTQKNQVFTKKDAIKKTRTHYICPAEGINEFSLFVDKEGNIVPVAEDVDPLTKVNIVTEDIIGIEDSAGYIERIKIRIPDRLSHLKSRTFDRAYGYIDSWYTAPTFTVSHTDTTYFHCELSKKRDPGQYNVFINGEKYGYRQNISFVIYNITPEPGCVFFDKEFVYIPKEYDRIEVVDAKSEPLFVLQDEAKVRFDGINVVNCTSVFQPRKNTKSIELVNCGFHNILKNILGYKYQKSLKNINITGCRFSNYAFIEQYPFIGVSASDCVGSITNSVFYQYEFGFCYYKNTAANISIHLCEKFDISDNIFINSTRGALYLHGGRIDVIANEFFNDSIFNSYPSRNLSRDAGAIYCGRLGSNDSRIREDNHNRIELRLNKIHDFYGKGDVRGIFIDDGRGDVTCYGNLIFNGQLYSIDSRNVKTDPYASVRNKYQYNIVAYPYRLTYGDSIGVDNRPVLDNNVLLFNHNECKATTPSTTDIRPVDFEFNGNEVMIGHDTWAQLPKDVRTMVRPLRKAN